MTAAKASRAPHSTGLVTGLLFACRRGRKLELEAFDLFGILGLLEHILVLVKGVAPLTDFGVGVAQVLRDGGVAASQIDRALQLIDRLLILASLVVNPAETVNAETVFGF